MNSHASFWEAVKGALHSLRGSKLRSFLTLLGIILATTTLIAVMSVISGMDVYIAKNVSSMGADGYRVQRIVMMGFDPKKYMEMLRRNPELNREEYEFLRQRLTMTKEIGINAGRSVTVHRGAEVSEGVGLQGASPNIGGDHQPGGGGGTLPLRDRERSPHERGVHRERSQGKVLCGASPVGQTLTVEGVQFEVVGVSKAKGSIFGQSQDNFLVIPIDTYFKIWGARSGMGFAATALDHDHLAQAQEEARMLLRSYRHLRPKEDDTFSMLTSDALLDFWNQLTGAIAATAVGVVSVFLVVGGVVIMNIMLAVVTERTHEIGIRKSVGARKRDILNQFLVESAVLSASGGVIGVVIAWVVAVLVRTFTPVPMSVPVTAVLVGVTLSAVVGLFFGIYPAQRAAQLDPIEALRAEK